MLLAASFRRVHVLVHKQATNASILKPLSRHYSSKKDGVRVLFFGTGHVALASAKLLHSRKDLISRFDLVVPPQKDVRHPLPTLAWATTQEIRCHQFWPKSASADITQHQQSIDSLSSLASTEFDVGIVVDFGYMIPGKLIQAFPRTPILMHPSLLPQYRGAAPIEHAIMNGDSQSGVTVLEVAANKFDAGRILLTRPYAMGARDSGEVIRRDLSELGAKTLVEVLERYEELNKSAVPQPEACTLAPKLTPADYQVNWQEMTRIRLYNQWRALGPLTTALHGCTHVRSISKDGSILTLLHELCHPSDFLAPSHLASDAPIGSLAFDKPNNLLWARCADDWIAIRSIQLESGRRILDAASFVNGIRLKLNPIQRLGPSTQP